MATKIVIHPAGQSGPFEIVSSVLPSQTLRYTMQLLRPDGSVLLKVEEDHATDVYSLVDVVAAALANEQTFSYGYDNQPYLWDGRRWVNANVWLQSVSTGMHRRIRSGEYRSKSSACFYNTMQALWIASGRKELALKPFGVCNGIPLADGVFEFEGANGLNVAPHKPENENLHFLPVSCDDVVKAFFEVQLNQCDESLLFRFLRTSLDPDQRKVLQRWFGLHLVVHKVGNPEKMLYMYGGGGNGKGMVVQMLRSLVTDDAVAALRLKDLTIPSNLELLIGKMAMIGAEGSPETDNEMLKTIVSWEELTVNPKYRDPFGLRPSCLVTQASNPTPHFDDDSDAMVRRVIVLHMTYKPTEAEKIQGIAERIRSAEYPLLVAWALHGALEVLQAGTIVVPQSVAELSAEIVRPVRTVDRFFEVLEFGRYEIAEDELYAAYCLHIKKQGLKVQPKAEFFEALMTRLDRKGILYQRRAKVTGYRAQAFMNDRQELSALVPALLAAKHVNAFFGLRIAEGHFGPAIGQVIPENRRDLPAFEVLNDLS
ncbi:primase [Acidovorax sp. NO-1]|uniref:DUF5906 domain-containing protein n=1 Tax=Acidovorax sp. NO-1 TaxID=512030 RepID=UPI00023FC84F|nr:DUF5906 domain-containing protein [Acidovorax sp. NO-1]EHL21074.1 primase [Acidovorax sp. NO-1]